MEFLKYTGVTKDLSAYAWYEFPPPCPAMMVMMMMTMTTRARTRTRDWRRWSASS